MAVSCQSVLDAFPGEINSDNNDLKQQIQNYHTPVIESSLEEANSKKTLRTRNNQKSRYIPQLEGPSVMIPITMSSEITSIMCGNPAIVQKSSNRPADLLMPNILGHKLIATSTNKYVPFPSTFLTPLDG